MIFSHPKHSSRIKLSATDMLAISQYISSQFAPGIEGTHPELVLLPVDPFTLYAYWNLGDYATSVEFKNASRTPLILRISSRPDLCANTGQAKICFDLVVQESQNQIKIAVPIDATVYSAEIGKRYPDRSFIVLASSNSVAVPRGNMAPLQRKQVPAAAENQLTSIPRRETKPASILTAQNHNDTAIDFSSNHAEPSPPSETPLDIPVTYAERHYESLKVINLDENRIQEFEPPKQDFAVFDYEAVICMDLLLNSDQKNSAQPLYANNNSSGQGIGE